MISARAGHVWNKVIIFLTRSSMNQYVFILGGGSGPWSLRRDIHTSVPRGSSSICHVQRAASARQPLHLSGQRAAYLRPNWYAIQYDNTNYVVEIFYVNMTQYITRINTLCARITVFRVEGYGCW